MRETLDISLLSLKQRFFFKHLTEQHLTQMMQTFNFDNIWVKFGFCITMN